MRGNIKQRTPGSWTVQVSAGFEPTTGRRVRVTRTVRGTERDAQRELTRLLREVDQGLVADPGRQTLTRYLEDRWLPHAATRVRPTTHDRYASLLRCHVEPRIGRLSLGKVRPVHVQAALDGMLADGLAPRTVLHAHRVLSQALRQAVRWQVLATNPATAAEPPEPERPKLHVPDQTAVRRLLDEAGEGPVYVALVLAASTGLRRGEVLGLRWSTVDLEAGEIGVVASLQRVRGELVFLDPKTDRSRRTIALPRFTVQVLKRWRADQAERRLLLGEAWQDAGVVVDRGDGRPFEPGELSRAFAAIAKRAGLKGVRLHDLRHAFATSLLEADIHPAIASQALGHASTAFTMDTYQHVLKPMGRKVAQTMQRALGNQGGMS